MIREREKDLVLGGWANPNGDAETQVRFLLDPGFAGEFYLTQIVSHHRLRPVESFLKQTRQRGVAIPGIFGVFYYRSANEKTLQALSQFLPVPSAELHAEFEAGASPQEVCARTLRALINLGATHFYVSNLPLGRAGTVFAEIVERVGVTA
jgi:hypothetical protein